MMGRIGAMPAVAISVYVGATDPDGQVATVPTNSKALVSCPFKPAINAACRSTAVAGLQFIEGCVKEARIAVMPAFPASIPYPAQVTLLITAGGLMIEEEYAEATATHGSTKRKENTARTRRVLGILGVKIVHIGCRRRIRAS